MLPQACGAMVGVRQVKQVLHPVGRDAEDAEEPAGSALPDDHFSARQRRNDVRYRGRRKASAMRSSNPLNAALYATPFGDVFKP